MCNLHGVAQSRTPCASAMCQASTSAMVAAMVHALPKYEVYIFNMCLCAAHYAIVRAWGGISALEWAGPWLGLLGQHGPSAVSPGFALQACCKKSHKSQDCGRLVAIGPLETADWPIVFAICGPWCFVLATNATWGQMPATFSVHCPAEPRNLIPGHLLPSGR